MRDTVSPRSASAAAWVWLCWSSASGPFCQFELLRQSLIFLIREIQRARAVFICFFVLTLLLATASCKRSDNTSNQNVGAANANGVSQETSATPPFATKEPERYQAVRIVTSSIGGGSADSGAEA